MLSKCSVTYSLAGALSRSEMGTACAGTWTVPSASILGAAPGSVCASAVAAAMSTQAIVTACSLTGKRPNLRSRWIDMETSPALLMASVVRHSGVDKLQQAQGLGASAARKFEAMTAGVQVDMQAGKFLVIAPSQIEHLIG